MEKRLQFRCTTVQQVMPISTPTPTPTHTGRHEHPQLDTRLQSTLPLRLSSGSQHRHGEVSPISAPRVQPIIETERLHTGIHNAPAGWSSTFDTVLQCNSDHHTTGESVTFRRAADWKLRQLKPTAKSTTEYWKHELENGRLGGAQGMAWFGFCLLSSVCFLSVFSMA
jgi:hypothetical protein